MIFVSGDRAAVEQIREFVGDVESAIVKEGVEQATISVSPRRALEMIDESVERAMRRYSDFRPYSASTPHSVEIDFSTEAQAGMASWVPSVSRVNPRSIRFTADDMLDAMRITRLLAIYVSP